MTKETKAFIFYFLIFFPVFQVVRWAFSFLLPDISSLYIAGISGAVTAILVPQFRSMEKEDGDKKIEVKWFFLKKPLFIR